MGYFIIELIGGGRRAFVESFSNTHGCVIETLVDGQAKPFSSEGEAHEWAKRYIPGYHYKVIPCGGQ